MKQKTILLFGYYDPDAARQKHLKQGLDSTRYLIRECHTTKRSFLAKVIDLAAQYWKIQKDIDVVYVPLPGHFIMPIAWLLTRIPRKVLIFDAFISLHDTIVMDRKKISRWNPYAWFLFFIDWLGCLLADVVLLDTLEHKQYFVDTFKIPEGKIIPLYIGADSDVFKPAKEKKSNDTFTIGFHGTFIPLQGIETILHAAKELQSDDVHFLIIGSGQTFVAIQRLALEDLMLANVTFEGRRTLAETAEMMRHVDVGLGIFGTTGKADRVIPHKAYEILSMRIPLITGNTTVARRVFHDGENALLSAPGNGGELAEKIRQLKGNPDLRKRVAENGHRLFLEKFNPQTIVGPLQSWLDTHLERWRRKFSLPASQDF